MTPKMITFKRFLLEGGTATKKWATGRASAVDIKSALKFVASAAGIPKEELQDNLLGSTEATLLGARPDSGDIDIALVLDKHDPAKVHADMMTATGNAGVWNAGTKIGSYSVPVDGHTVQVDLMFVSDRKWAKFAYHSSMGQGSAYPGAVRNIILTTALSHTQEPGKDFVLKDSDSRVIARASRSLTLGGGMSRMFKHVVRKKDGSLGQTLQKTSAEDLEQFLADIGQEISFSHREDATQDPDAVAAFIFGPGVVATDIMSAEAVITHIKKLPNSAEILKAAKAALQQAKLPIPSEL